MEEEKNKLPGTFSVQHNFWDELYRSNETGWDLKGVSPPIRAYIDTLRNKQMSILIPGCGNAYEADYLLQNGFTHVTLIDISSELVSRLQQKFKDLPVRVLHGNFFEHSGQYDLIIEQTFFCAIPPALRQQYAEQCYRLLKPGGKIAGLLFDIVFEKQGPPFGGSRQEYTLLFEPLFDLQQFDTCTTSVKPRLGNELFVEMQKLNKQ